jgi:hypothetical protein
MCGIVDRQTSCEAAYGFVEESAYDVHHGYVQQRLDESTANEKQLENARSGCY